jgi:hypothetical protein
MTFFYFRSEFTFEDSETMVKGTLKKNYKIIKKNYHYIVKNKLKKKDRHICIGLFKYNNFTITQQQLRMGLQQILLYVILL